MTYGTSEVYGIVQSEMNNSTHKPYLSIVATARHDNHGGNLLGRMQLFIDGILEQCNRFQLPAELIIVEWNPPKDRPRLVEALNCSNLHTHGDWCSIRIIEVPHHIHSRFKYAESLPLFQMIGKNVGIRRSIGEFILATNIDILFTDELIGFLSRQSLQYEKMYRIDRCDIDPPPSMEDPIPTRLDWCKQHIVRINNQYESVNLRTGRSYPAAWKPTWRVKLMEFLQNHSLIPIVTRPPLHLNTCGDFTLLHRDHWFALRGYAELEMYSMHLDSLFCTAASVAGLQEMILNDPMRIYHIEHGTGSGFQPEQVSALNNRLENSGIPQLSMTDFHRAAIEMRRNDQPTLFNDDNWGLYNETLTEINPFNTTNHTVNTTSREPCLA